MPDTLTIEHVPGPSDGHDPRGHYVDVFWSPVLGPTATVLLRRLAAVRPGTTVTVASLGAALGIGPRQLRRGLGRLSHFHVVVWINGRVQVPQRVPSLDPGLAAQLPDSLRSLHAQALQRQAG